MIVSILQMMGFPKGKPDKVRAEESNAAKLKKAAANPPVTTRAAPKPAIQAEPQPATKSAAEKKPLPTAPSKKAKLAEALAPAPTVKKPEPAQDAKVKKNGNKNAAAEPATAKATVEKVKPTTKEKIQHDTKTKEKPSSKSVAKPEPKLAKAVKPVTVKTPAESLKSMAAAVQAAPAAVKKSAAKAVAAAVKPMAALPALVAAAAKAARPSSRLAQITVPSMAQSVASTAAKSSYSQTPPSPAMAPVIPAIVKKDTKLANNWKSKPVAQLTDAELLAMPDAEYMNEVQLAAFRLKLSELKSGILSNAGETTEHLREDSSVVPDPADRATIEEEHALELRTRDRERKLLKKIEQSISRIDAGDYGYCDETGEPIGVGRLLARPTATLSLEAQQRRELKQKMFGD